ncbi:MAG: hypothetical protein P4L33_02520 [Capsulimonadaceae bacterium]|nr:hypothetical protein [Capsulimonadaceae bacterium]
MQGDLEETTESLDDFIKRLGLSYDVQLVNTEEGTWTYKVHFRREGKDLELSYEDYDENPQSQVARDALDEAASDAACVENSSNLWEWCNEYYGLEPHNPIIPDPEATFLIQHRRAKDLKEFLGDDEYSTLLFSVERLYETD